jgi:formate dehydrogenase major subunit
MHLRNSIKTGQFICTASFFTDCFPTARCNGKIVLAEFIHADQLPDNESPLVFTTERQLEY